jgi:hypothetical protein
MRQYFLRSLENVTKYGDTDIFPFPVENHIFHDCKAEVVDLLLDIDARFTEVLAQFPPANHSALVPIGYTGFRWVTQIDPLWNTYFLGLVLSIADAMEASRLPAGKNIVFSYRYQMELLHKRII